MSVSTVLTESFIMDIQPALDDAHNDAEHPLHEVAVALDTSQRHTINGKVVSHTVRLSVDAVKELIDEARWRYGAWEGSPDRCIAEHHRRFCQSIGVQPQPL